MTHGHGQRHFRIMIKQLLRQGQGHAPNGIQAVPVMFPNYIQALPATVPTADQALLGTPQHCARDASGTLPNSAQESRITHTSDDQECSVAVLNIELINGVWAPPQTMCILPMWAPLRQTCQCIGPTNTCRIVKVVCVCNPRGFSQC